MDLKKIQEKAHSRRGCLRYRRTPVGRRRYCGEENDDPLVIDCFVSDEAKLLSSKSFRVLNDKTQVFTFPRNALIRSRQSHVMEVVAVSVVASEMLGLNTSLVRAAAIGHDIGHVPFGHQGEMWMAKAMNRPEFCHEVMAPIVAQKIERKGQGLNLTHETLEAMMCHSGSQARQGMSQEAWLLRYTDKITYLFADYNDIVVRMGYPISKELQDLVESFGSNQRERTTTAICGLVIESATAVQVSFQYSERGEKFKLLRDLMYSVYPHVTQQNVRSSMEPVLEFLEMLKIGDPFLLLARMTDHEVAALAANPMRDMQAFNRTAISEMLPYLNEIGPLDLCDPDLNW